MANDKFTHQTLPFDCTGMNLADPVDRMPPGKHRLLYNTRVYTGTVQGRTGIMQATTAAEATPVHSLCSWSDPIEDATLFPTAHYKHNRMAGIGTKVYIASDDGPNPAAFVAPDTGYSGYPNTFVVSGSSVSARPVAFVGDFNKNTKFNSAQQALHMGVAPPNFVPDTFIGPANALGPDVGTTGVPYVYRVVARTYRSYNTGCISSGGPPQRESLGLSPAGEDVNVSVAQAHPDPQVINLDIYRFGGSLPVWKLIGSIPNIAGGSMFDTFADGDIAANPELEDDNNQPFMSVDISRNGTCNVVSSGTGLGAFLTITGGDTFKAYDAVGSNPFYPAGNQIRIDGLLCTMYRSPDSTTYVEILEDLPTTSGSLWEMVAPEIMHQPLPFLWGPYGGGATGVFIFACGDVLRPQALYWTKGNHPESHPGTNVLDVTSASEPLQNGVMFNGNAYVFSTDRMFAIYPTLGGISDFIALEVPNSRGLFARWAVCETPFGIAFVGKDGVYLSTGGPPINLTDADLYPLFPHEIQNTSNQSLLPTIDGLAYSALVPNFALPDSMKLTFGDGFLYFDFVDMQGNFVTLVGQFDMSSQKFLGWTSYDTYTPQVTCRTYEIFSDVQDVTANVNRMLMGTLVGNLAEYTGPTDNGTVFTGVIQTGSSDFGDSRPRKLMGDMELDLDALCETLSIQAGFDNFSYLSTVALTGTNLTGRHREIGDINAGKGQYANNLGLLIQWTASTSQPIFYTWMPSYLPKVELTVLRVTDWDDAEYFGAKFIQGFILHCDTLGVARQIAVESDGGVTQEVFTVSASNEQELAFSFATPFISHFVRLWPQDSEFWRIFRIRWIYEPSPELVTTWTTQPTTHDLQGWFAHRDAYIPIISSAAVTLTVNTTGNPGGPFTYSLASTGSAYSKIYQVLQNMKALSAAYSFTSSAGFRLFQKDLEVRVKKWGDVGPYLSKMPAGDLSRINGARI